MVGNKCNGGKQEKESKFIFYLSQVYFTVMVPSCLERFLQCSINSYSTQILVPSAFGSEDIISDRDLLDR